MAGTAQDVIAAAESQISCTNGAKYFNYFGAPDYGPWCVAFVRWCMAQADVSFPWETWYAWDWSDAPNAIAPHDLQAGDAVSFDWDDDNGGDHVGIVKSVHDWGIVTIEGNTSGGVVAERQRVWAVVICGIRPKFKSSKAGWVKSGDRWWYRYADGSYPKSKWLMLSGKWYYFDADGWMVTGWVNTAGKWYWCDKTKGSTEGQMLESTIIEDGGYFYALGKDGAMITTSVKASQDHDGHFGHLVL